MQSSTQSFGLQSGSSLGSGTPVGVGKGAGTSPDGSGEMLLGCGTTGEGSMALLVGIVLPVVDGSGSGPEDDRFFGPDDAGSGGSDFDGLFGSVDGPDGGVELVNEPTGGRGTKRPVELILLTIPLGGTVESLWLTLIRNHAVVDPSTELIQDTFGISELPEGTADADAERVIGPRGGRVVGPSVELIAPLAGGIELLGSTVMGNHTVADSSTELTQDTIGIPELPDGDTDEDAGLL